MPFLVGASGPVLDRGREREHRRRDRREAERDRERRRRGRRGKQRRDDHRAERERELDQYAVDRERHHARTLVVEAMAPHRAREHADRRQEAPARPRRQSPSRRARSSRRAKSTTASANGQTRPVAKSTGAGPRRSTMCPRNGPVTADAPADTLHRGARCREASGQRPHVKQKRQRQHANGHASDQRGHEQRRNVGMPEKRAIARESARQHRLGNALVESQ